MKPSAVNKTDRDSVVAILFGHGSGVAQQLCLFPSLGYGSVMIYWRMRRLSVSKTIVLINCSDGRWGEGCVECRC